MQGWAFHRASLGPEQSNCTNHGGHGHNSHAATSGSGRRILRRRSGGGLVSSGAVPDGRCGGVPHGPHGGRSGRRFRDGSGRTISIRTDDDACGVIAADGGGDADDAVVTVELGQEGVEGVAVGTGELVEGILDFRGQLNLGKGGNGRVDGKEGGAYTIALAFHKAAIGAAKVGLAALGRGTCLQAAGISVCRLQTLGRAQVAEAGGCLLERALLLGYI